MQNRIPVLIIGAGPTGLTMALELDRHGIPSRIIDKQIKPVLHSNALAVQARTLYAWEDMGLITDALSHGEQIKALNIYTKDKKLANIHLDILEGDKKFVLGLSQHETETMLIAHLQEKNIHVEMEVTLTDFEEKEDFVKVILQGKDGTKEEVNAEWIIACDGGHSFVRDKLKIPFIGKELPQHFVLADAKVQSELAKNEGHFFISDKGIFLFIPFNNQFSRIIADVSEDSVLSEAKSLTYDQVKTLAEERCPIKLNIHEPIWTSGFWIHENMIGNYRHSHVFFAGDAAHIHSPAGGQGMNTGIQDAYNLAWKLACVIQKKAKPIILDSYQSERYQVGRKLLRATTMMTNIMTTHNKIVIGIRNLVIAHFSKMRFVQKKLVNTLSELRICYTDTMLVKDCLQGHGGPLPGTFKADFYPKLSVILNGSQFVLLFFAANKNEAQNFAEFKANFKYGHLVKWVYINDDVTSWSDICFKDEALVLHKTLDITSPSLYLIRPDKYIGFRGQLQHKAELENYFANFSEQIPSASFGI